MTAPAQQVASLADLLSPQDPRKKLLLAQALQGTDTSPVQHWTQGAARALNAAIGGYGLGTLELEKKLQAQNVRDALLADPAIGGSGVVPPQREVPGFFEKMASLGSLFGGVAPQPPAAVPPMGGVVGSPLPGAPTAYPVPPPPPPPNPVSSQPLPPAPPPPPRTPFQDRVASVEEAIRNKTMMQQGAYPGASPDDRFGLIGRPSPVTAGAPPATAVSQPPVAPPPPVPPGAAPTYAYPGPMPNVPPTGPMPGGTVPPRPEQTIPAARQGYIRGLYGGDHTVPLGLAEKEKYSKPAEYDYKEMPNGDWMIFNKGNPNDIRTYKANSQELIDFKARVKGAETAAEKAVQYSPENIKGAGALAGETTRAESQAKLDVAKPLQEKFRKDAAAIVTDDIDRAIANIKGEKWNDPSTGLTGQLASRIPGTQAHNLGNLLTTIKANASFDALMRMRQASPTGAALGPVSDFENKQLAAAQGALEQSQDAKQLTYNLKRFKNVMLDIIHGPGQGPKREGLQGTGAAFTTSTGVQWSP